MFDLIVSKCEGLDGFTVRCYGWVIYFLLLGVIQPEFLLLAVICEITVKCYNTF